jgi:hypothetical protein
LFTETKAMHGFVLRNRAGNATVDTNVGPAESVAAFNIVTNGTCAVTFRPTRVNLIVTFAEVIVERLKAVV